MRHMDFPYVTQAPLYPSSLQYSSCFFCAMLLNFFRLEILLSLLTFLSSSLRSRCYRMGLCSTADYPHCYYHRGRCCRFASHLNSCCSSGHSHYCYGLGQCSSMVSPHCVCHGWLRNRFAYRSRFRCLRLQSHYRCLLGVSSLTVYL